MENKLDIGLTLYQELQWLPAIKVYGASIMDKSLLSQEQKEALLLIAAECGCRESGNASYTCPRHYDIVNHRVKEVK